MAHGHSLVSSKVLCGLMLGACLAPSWLLHSARAAAPEFRCMWVTRYEWPDDPKVLDMNVRKATLMQKIDTIMDKLKAANFNAVMFQVRGQCDTLYPSPYEPWSPLIDLEMHAPTNGVPYPLFPADEDFPNGWDPLAYTIKAAHERGLEFHAYINTHTCWAMSSNCALREPVDTSNHIYFQHCKASDATKRDWLLHNNSALDPNDALPNKQVGSPVQCAESNYVWMSPTVPDMQAYVRKQIMYVVTHYDGSDPIARPRIDAVHWDRIRTPSSSSTTLQYSHDPISVQRFNSGEANPEGLDWFAWTRDAISRFTQDIYAEINEVRPDVVVSSSPLGLYSPSSYTQYGYPQTDCGYQYEYTCVHQDGQGWLARGSMDILNPQIYWADLPWRSANPHYSQVLPDWIANRAGRLMCPGHIGAVGSHPVESIVHEVKQTRLLGGQGDVVFSYGMWDNASFNGWAGFTDPVNGVYQESAAMPVMPWKAQPTEGIIIGTVTDSDGVTPLVDVQVTRSGDPSGYTALSSGDGLYSFLKVAPGTYTLSFVKNGYATGLASVTVTAGGTSRVDMSLTLPSPAPRALAWRSIRSHSGSGDLAIPLTFERALGGVEPRNGGTQLIEVDFDQPVNLVAPIGVQGWTTTNGVLGPMVAYPAPSTAVALAGRRLRLTVAAIPDATYCRISLAGCISSMSDVSLTGDNDCGFIALVGDVTADRTVALADLAMTKGKSGQSPNFGPRCDVNGSGSVDAGDISLIKSTFGQKALMP